MDPGSRFAWPGRRPRGRRARRPLGWWLGIVARHPCSATLFERASAGEARAERWLSERKATPPSPRSPRTQAQPEIRGPFVSRAAAMGLRGRRRDPAAALQSSFSRSAPAGVLPDGASRRAGIGEPRAPVIGLGKSRKRRGSPVPGRGCALPGMTKREGGARGGGKAAASRKNGCPRWRGRRTACRLTPAEVANGSRVALSLARDDGRGGGGLGGLSGGGSALLLDILARQPCSRGRRLARRERSGG